MEADARAGEAFLKKTRAAAILLAALLYVLMPLDIVPDFWPLVGWIDDLMAIGLAGYLMWRGWKGRVGGASASGVEPEPPRTEEDPYVTLGVARGASAEEIRQAYRSRMAEYHPDKVAHLGPELKRLAEQKTLAIQRAYERLGSG